MQIQSNGVRLEIKLSGVPLIDDAQGPLAVVFLHYWGGASRTWDAVVGALPPHRSFVRPDLRGWGQSQPVTGGYTLDDYVQDVGAVVQALGGQRYVLVGHSMGGKIAQAFAAARPAGLAGLVLVAPAPPDAIHLPPEALAAMARAYDTAESVEGAIDHMLTAVPLSARHRAQVIEDSLRGTPEAKRAWPQHIALDDITGQVAAIDVPTLIIAGAADQVDSVAVLQEALLPRIAEAELQVLGGTGHLSPLEAPQALARAIETFLARL